MASQQWAEPRQCLWSAVASKKPSFVHLKHDVEETLAPLFSSTRLQIVIALALQMLSKVNLHSPAKNQERSSNILCKFSTKEGTPRYDTTTGTVGC